MDPRIEQYLLGQLDENDKAAFEKEMENDSSLKEEVRTHAGVLQGLDEIRAEKLKSHFQELESNLPKEESNEEKVVEMQPSKGLGSIWKVAAAIVLLAIPTYLILNSGPTADELYNQYYQSYPNVITSTERSQEENPPEQNEALAYYESGNFEAAIEAFQAELEELPEAADMQFYLGVSQMETNRLEHAIESLTAVVESNNTQFRDQALWYLALAKMKNGNEVEAEGLLKHIITKENSYSTRAEEILEQL